MEETIYVKKIPKCCEDCQFDGYGNDKYYCCADGHDTDSFDGRWTTRHSECPLKLLNDYKKELVAKVLDRIKDYIDKHNHVVPIVSKNRNVVYSIGLMRILDQIQKDLDNEDNKN